MHLFVLATTAAIANSVSPSTTTPGDPRAASFSIDLDLEASTRYFFRGYRVIDDPVAQIALDLSLELDTGSSFRLTPFAGFRSILAPAKYGHDGWRNWNEAITTAGLELEWNHATLDLEYNLYTYPSDFSGQAQEVGAVLAFDDADLAASSYRLALHPHVATYVELEDRGDSSLDQYLELGLEPALLGDRDSERGFSLTLPATLGTSTDHFYTDASGANEFLGFLSVGPHARLALSRFVQLHAAADYLHLYADSAVAADGGERDVLVGTFGIAVSF